MEIITAVRKWTQMPIIVVSGNDIINNSKECSKYAMYGIENPEEFEKAVKSYLPLR